MTKCAGYGSDLTSNGSKRMQRGGVQRGLEETRKHMRQDSCSGTVMLRGQKLYLLCSEAYKPL